MLKVKQNKKPKLNKNPNAKTEQDNSNNKHRHIHNQAEEIQSTVERGSLRQSNDLVFSPSICEPCEQQRLQNGYVPHQRSGLKGIHTSI